MKLVYCIKYCGFLDVLYSFYNKWKTLLTKEVLTWLIRLPLLIMSKKGLECFIAPRLKDERLISITIT